MQVIYSLRAARYRMAYGPTPAHGPRVGDHCSDGGFKGGTKSADGSRSNILMIVCSICVPVYDKPTMFEHLEMTDRPSGPRQRARPVQSSWM